MRDIKLQEMCTKDVLKWKTQSEKKALVAEKMFTQAVSKVNCYRIYWILVKSICFLSQQLLKKYSVNIWKTWRHIGTEITNKSALYYYNVIFLFSILQHYLRSGEKASYYGEPCDKCGKYPRAPYRNYDN